MLEKKKILAVIVARKGSKRLKKKNVIDLHGKPLVDWTFTETIKSEYIDKIMISTDDDEVIKCGKKYSQIEIPFIRPKELSSDTATSIEVLLHAIKFYENKNQIFDYVLLLQPTSPLREKKDIDNAIMRLENNKIKAIVSVCETEHPPLWSNTLPNDLSMRNFVNPKIKNLRSQDLPKYYRINGAIYIAEVNYLKKNNGFIGGETFAYIMPAERSIDIDTKIDFELCKILMNENSKNNS